MKRLSATKPNNELTALLKTLGCSRVFLRKVLGTRYGSVGTRFL